VRVVILLAAGFLASAALPTRVAAQSQEEARAIFLYNFAKFVEWPAGAFAEGTTPVTIAVVGDAEVAKALERYVKGKNANGRDLVVKKLDAADGCADAHIVFVGNAKFTDAVITQITGKPVLSVGEDENFLKAGGAIRLFAKDNKVLCAINTKAADAAGLKLGDKLVKASS
jgi:hypothetical protein